MDSDLSLEFLRVVEQAAIACAHTMGQGDRHKSDQAAVEAMRKVMDTVPIDGTIVIGEGERDEAPMLYIGEKVGLVNAKNLHGLKLVRFDEVDIAGDPQLEAAYREWLPVVEIDGERAFVYFVDPAAFQRKIAAQS